MPAVAVNGSATPSNPNAFSGWNPIWCRMAVPLARVAANGSRLMITDALHLVGGSGGTMGLFIANADGSDYVSTAGFGSVQSGSWDTGWRGVNKWFSGIQPGWEMRVGFTFGGTLHYGRHAAGGSIYNRDGGAGQVEWTGASLSGEVAYYEVPPAPTMLGVSTLSNGLTRVQFQGNGDGDSPITRWLLQYSTNSNFSGGTTIESSGTSDLNLPPGTYYFRSAGCNYVSDVFGTSGPWSSSMSYTVSARGKRWTGSAWTALSTAKRWTGSSWVDLTTMKRWNGSAWVDLSS